MLIPMRTRNSYPMTQLSGIGETQMRNASSFRTSTITFVASGLANLTVKCYTSNQENEPDLGAAAAIDNQYSEAQMTSLNDGQSVDGTTGIIYNGATDGISRYELNDNNTRWVGFKVTSHTTGTIDTFIDMVDNG